jgi:hypothetical protein
MKEPPKTRRRFTDSRGNYRRYIKSLPLSEFFVERGSVAEGQRALAKVLDSAHERHVQRVVEEYPRLLTQHLCTQMGWVVPQKRLGSEHVTDFLIAEQLSPGIYWQAVELESPKSPLFTKSGDPSRQLTHAIRQIQDWRIWIASNQAYASRSRKDNGLGLQEISPNLPGLILIGRRQQTDPATNARRRQMMADLRIQIRTFDSLLDSLPDNVHRLPLYVKFGDRALERGYEMAPPMTPLKRSVGRRRSPAAPRED